MNIKILEMTSLYAESKSYINRAELIGIEQPKNSDSPQVAIQLINNVAPNRVFGKLKDILN